MAEVLAEHFRAGEVPLREARANESGTHAVDADAVGAEFIGGGVNHRFSLGDQVMLKDNHIDAAGGIGPAMTAMREYLKSHRLDLPVEIETRTLGEVRQALKENPDVILFDNMDVGQLREAVSLVDGRCRTEASGGITESNLRAVAETGVDFISSGALTHSVKSMDLSLKIGSGG